MVEVLLVVTILWSAAGTVLTVYFLTQSRRDQADQADRTWKNLADLKNRLSADVAEVHKGLAAMQALAQDVGGLKKILSNVKTRGILGEAALEGLLTEYLAPDQLERNCEIRPGSGLRVEFAVRLPGQDRPVLLPVDAKFPREDFERLLEAGEAGDKVAAETAGKAFENRLRAHAQDIAKKYLDPPHSTDFALMFLPFESLFAEALRRPGLFMELQQKLKIVLTGPTTLTAFLNSLQMGFQTLAVSKKSAEVWSFLATVKTEFEKFIETLSQARKSVESAASFLDQASRRSEKLERRLSDLGKGNDVS
ncbi:MAG: DNA recombination protein RmuC [Spirochaetales bacterium]|nr:DNA recombination protein RmuC [Spirochaetales bacterium]